jgi:hypothetical protein
MNEPSDYKNIPVADKISDEEIRITEKVLKACGEAKGMSISNFEVIMFMRRTTNVLRYFNNMTLLNLQYHDDMRLVCIYHDELVVVEILRSEVYEWEHGCQQFFEVIREANETDLRNLKVKNIYGANK